LPLLTKYPLFLCFWNNQLALLFEFFKYYLAGVQKHRMGLIAILNIIFKYTNNRSKDLNAYINLANIYYNRLDADCSSGHQFIQVAMGRDKQAGVPIA
jgi:hypothetical protein